MNYLTKEWQPSHKLLEELKEVDHNEETKYFKYFNIRNNKCNETIVLPTRFTEVMLGDK